MAKAKKKTGRPSTYTPALGRKICMMIAKDVAVVDVLKQPGMPSEGAVLNWLQKGDRGIEPYDEFVRFYVRAKQMAAEHGWSEMIRIERAMLLPKTIANPDYDERMAAKSKENGQSYDVPKTIRNPDYIDPAHGREVLTNMKWRMAKAMPRVYGDRLEVAHSGKVEHDHTHRAEPPEWMKARIDQDRPPDMIDVTPVNSEATH